MSGHRRCGQLFGNRRGIALVVVLWATTLLAVLAASFTGTSRTEVLLARNLVENAKAEALADAGVPYAVMGLLERDPARQWRADGSRYEIAMGEGRVGISLQDEGGKVDLNAAPEGLVAALLTSLGLADEDAAALADAIADFRDPDDLRRANGAEDADYRNAGLAHGAKDAPFETSDELLRVMGMTPALYRALAPLVTVYSGRAGVDPGVAPPGVLLALPGYDRAAVDELVAGREETAESGPGGGTTAPPVPRGQRGFTARSRRTAFSVRAEATTEGGGLFVREAVISLTRLPDAPYRVHDWRQGRRAEPPAPNAE